LARYLFNAVYNLVCFHLSNIISTLAKIRIIFEMTKKLFKKMLNRVSSLHKTLKHLTRQAARPLAIGVKKGGCAYFDTPSIVYG